MTSRKYYSYCPVCKLTAGASFCQYCGTRCNPPIKVADQWPGTHKCICGFQELADTYKFCICCGIRNPNYIEPVSIFQKIKDRFN